MPLSEAMTIASRMPMNGVLITCHQQGTLSFANNKAHVLSCKLVLGAIVVDVYETYIFRASSYLSG